LVSKLIKPADAASTKVYFVPLGNGNIKLAAFCPDVILTMVIPKTGFLNPFSTTWEAFKPIAIKKDTDITFEEQTHSIHVRYGMDQCWLPIDHKEHTLPQAPRTTATNDKTILDAISIASRCKGAVFGTSFLLAV